MKYRNTSTGEIFTMDEIKESFEQFRYDMKTEYDSFEEYFEAMCDRGDFEEVEEMTTWYAVMEDRADSDWGYGSHDLDEAKQMLKDAEYTDGYIAVIENDVCIKELTQDELFEED